MAWESFPRNSESESDSFGERLSRYSLRCFIVNGSQMFGHLGRPWQLEDPEWGQQWLVQVKVMEEESIANLVADLIKHAFIPGNLPVFPAQSGGLLGNLAKIE